MGAIIDFFSNLFDTIGNLFKLIFWWISGIFDLGEMFTSSINILVDVLDFFPVAVVSGLMAVCSVLLILRIFGRA